MAKFKHIWGPTNEEATRTKIKLSFFTVDENGEGRGYTLVFYLDSRKFKVRPHITGQAKRYAERMAEKDLFRLPEVQRSVEVEGKVTDLLRERLSPEQIAEATAAAIRWSMS